VSCDVTGKGNDIALLTTKSKDLERVGEGTKMGPRDQGASLSWKEGNLLEWKKKSFKEGEKPSATKQETGLEEGRKVWKGTLQSFNPRSEIEGVNINLLGEER